MKTRKLTVEQKKQVATISGMIRRQETTGTYYIKVPVIRMTLFLGKVQPELKPDSLGCCIHIWDETDKIKGTVSFCFHGTELDDVSIHF